eukprot:3365187-Pyramimonas_sp.AAC.1
MGTPPPDHDEGRDDQEAPHQDKVAVHHIARDAHVPPVVDVQGRDEKPDNKMNRNRKSASDTKQTANIQSHKQE